MTTETTPTGKLAIWVGLGVFWFVWGHYGFWWGVLYGLCWPVWAGYRLAEALLGV